ncbi:MAG TPA: hypothetical protein VGL81_23545 [Polyangiaceae bacterium]
MNTPKPTLLTKTSLHVTDDHAKALQDPEQSVYFDWWPDSARYNAHTVPRLSLPSPQLPGRLLPR